MYLYSGVKKSMHQNVTLTHNYKEKYFFPSISIIEKKKSMYSVVCWQESTSTYSHNDLNEASANKIK